MSRSHAELVALHIQLLPFFAHAAISRQQLISAVVAANPEIPLGGLPPAPKDSRYGQNKEYFLPTRRFAQTRQCQKFINNHKPVILKPVFGSQSRNVSYHDNLRVEKYAPKEPMLVQKYTEGKEFGICIDRSNDTDCYSVVEIDSKTDIWNGEASFYNLTDQTSNKLTAAANEVCTEARLQFGRLDVRSPSRKDLLAGNFTVLEINGSTALDLRLYTNASYTQKKKWLKEHWQRLLRTADKNAPSDITPGLLLCCLFFTISPLRAVHLWNYIE